MDAPTDEAANFLREASKCLELASLMSLKTDRDRLMEMAQRWVSLARSNSITTQWIEAKLLMRDGKIDQAAAILARISRAFPAQPMKEIRPSEQKLENSLLIDGEAEYPTAEISGIE